MDARQLFGFFCFVLFVLLCLFISQQTEESRLVIDQSKTCKTKGKIKMGWGSILRDKKKKSSSFIVIAK